MEKGLLERLLERVEADNADRAQHFEAPIPDAASAELIAQVEDELGFEIHTDLSDLYQSVGNGGFGPTCRLLGIGEGGAVSDLGKTADQEYLARREPSEDDPSWFWPEGVLPVHYHGCDIYSCVDCRSQDGAMLRFDPNGCDRWEHAWQSEGRGLMQWLSAWLDGRDVFACDQPFWSEAKERAR